MLNQSAIGRTRHRPGSRPRAILFDLDGTLIDSIELILASMRYAFDKCEAPAPSDAEWLAGVGTPLRTMFEHYTSDEESIDRFIAAYREHQLANHDRLVRSFEDVPQTIAALKSAGHPLAVVTSKTGALAQRGLEHVGLAHYFDTIVGCDSCTRHKPHPEPVLMALNRLGYEPEEALFVGDSVHDIESGNAAGVLTIAALWGPFTRDQLAVAEPGRYLERAGDLLQVLTER
jgi:pyrophosphatase PpaX